MYPEFMIVQIIEVERNGKLSPYAVRYLGRMDYFELDFITKDSLKKFFIKNDMDDGDYLVIHDNENSGDKYVVDTVLNYHTKNDNHFLDFRKPGQNWIDLVNNTMELTPILDIELKVKTSNKIKMPKYVTVAAE